MTRTSKAIAVACSLLVLSVITAQGKERQRAWQTGKVLDSDRASKYVGNTASGEKSGKVTEDGIYHETSNSDSTAVYRVYQTYVIELGDRVYVATERLRWRWSKPADVTVNAPVKVAIEKNKLYLLGEDGKEHEAEIVKKALKATETEQIR